MRLICLLLFGALIQVSAASYSQTKKVTVSGENLSFRDVLKIIEEQSEFSFFYNVNQLEAGKQFDLDFENESLESLMEVLLKDSELTYSVNDRLVIIHREEDAGLVENMVKQKAVSGTVTDAGGNPLPGVTVVVKGTTKGTITNEEGGYLLQDVPEDATLVFSFVGMISREVTVGTQKVIDVTLEQDVIGIEEVVAIGYGTVKKSDLTGAVASVSEDRLEMKPNVNIAEAIQGAIPGILVTQTSARAAPEQSIMIRGRNSITAGNNPLIIVDGIPYNGGLNDFNPSDVESIDVLKDASSTAIYGSRGANGVIIITTKKGTKGKAKLTYDGKYSLKTAYNFPETMTGEEFYQYKNTIDPGAFKPKELEIYESGEFVDWAGIVMNPAGHTHDHTLSISGGSENNQYYISGNLLDVKGIAVNDHYQRITGRINFEQQLGILSMGTNTSMAFNDNSGQPAQIRRTYGYGYISPLSEAYNEDGSLTIYPYEWDPHYENPLSRTLYEDTNKVYQINSNLFAAVEIPFVKGLSFRNNTGLALRFSDQDTYRGRNTTSGFESNGIGIVTNTLMNNITVDNILSYDRDFGLHSVNATALYSYEKNEFKSKGSEMEDFPNDFLTFYAARQAQSTNANFDYYRTALLSQMFRLNYVFDSRYLATFTVRRDGYSGFGEKTKFGVFPSFALGYNVAQEAFFPWQDLFSQLKLRASWGKNGNQAVKPYESITRLEEENNLNLNTSMPGFIPSVLGQSTLGWESTATLNLGVDFIMFSDRVSGDLNFYKSNTEDLLLSRSISPVHGIDQITQNIGKTENVGFEMSVFSRNIDGGNFKWSTQLNFSTNRNKIVSLYGELDEEGNEIDDIGSRWFIGEPIAVVFDYKRLGTWQLDEAEEAAVYGSEPGYAKGEDVDGGDGVMNIDDMQILGQRDPKFMGGMTNTFSYKNFSLDVFMYGVYGVTKHNFLMNDAADTEVALATRPKDWWTPDNPTNTYNKIGVFTHMMAGVGIPWVEDASFLRIKDVSLGYDVPLNQGARVDRLKVYLTGRNLYTFTSWIGTDPELPAGYGEHDVPIQMEFVLGVKVGF